MLRRVVAPLLAGLVLTSCLNPSDTPRQRAGGCEVGIVGDSLTVGSQSQGGIEAKLAQAGCTVTAVDAVIGRSTAAGADVVERWADAGTLPAILVVELGTNDCSAAGFEAAARRILAAAGPDRPVVWVTTWREGCDATINRVIERLQREGASGQGADRIWLVDHHTWIAAQRELLAADGIHLTATGYDAYAQRIVDALGPIDAPVPTQAQIAVEHATSLLFSPA